LIYAVAICDLVYFTVSITISITISVTFTFTVAIFAIPSSIS
jgi:hypothetical protein